MIFNTILIQVEFYWPKWKRKLLIIIQTNTKILQTKTKIKFASEEYAAKHDDFEELPACRPPCSHFVTSYSWRRCWAIVTPRVCVCDFVFLYIWYTTSNREERFSNHFKDHTHKSLLVHSCVATYAFCTHNVSLQYNVSRKALYRMVLVGVLVYGRDYSRMQ